LTIPAPAPAPGAAALSALGVEPGRRLVEEEDLGAAEDRQRQIEPPLLTA
jgi:hypothetical protein